MMPAGQERNKLPQLCKVALISSLVGRGDQGSYVPLYPTPTHATGPAGRRLTGCPLTGPPSRVYKPRSLGVLGRDLGEGLHGHFPGPAGWDLGKRHGSALFSHCSWSISECTIPTLVFLPVHWDGQPPCPRPFPFPGYCGALRNLSLSRIQLLSLPCHTPTGTCSGLFLLLHRGPSRKPFPPVSRTRLRCQTATSLAWPPDRPCHEHRPGSTPTPEPGPL